MTRTGSPIGWLACCILALWSLVAAACGPAGGGGAGAASEAPATVEEAVRAVAGEGGAETTPTAAAEVTATPTAAADVTATPVEEPATEADQPDEELTPGVPCGDTAVMDAFPACRAARTKQACVDAGGSWGPGGLTRQSFCHCPTGQGGCPCSDASDCLGYCSAEVTPRCQDIEATCNAWVPTFGCRCTFRSDGPPAMFCAD